MAEPRTPVHELRDRLEAANLKAIERLASQGTPLDEVPADVLRHVADLHTVLVAVRDEIERQEPRMGHGSERPLE